MTLALISHPDCALHDMGQFHPECPARLDAIQDSLIASGLAFTLRHYDAPRATREQLLRVHSQQFLDLLYTQSPQSGLVAIDADTSMNPHTIPAALRAAGAGILAVDLIQAGEITVAFCNIRPPGHHAERSRAMGLCFFNNIAIAAAHALATCDLERVAIVDFDVHHGNGTENIFLHDARVLLCSTFQSPLYPYTGTDTQSDHIVNVPLAPATTGRVFREAISTYWLPALHAHQPQMLFISAGFDGHIDDDCASLCLTEEDYAWVTGELRLIAERYSNGRIVSMLEGGYALSALGRSVVAHLKALL